MPNTQGPLQALRRQNLQLIVDLLESKGALSRADLARHAKLSRTTLSLLVKDLISAKLVQEVGDTVSTGGRPGILLTLDDTEWHALGAELHGREWIFVLLDMAGNVKKRFEFPLSAGDPNEALRVLIDGIHTAHAECTYRILPAIGVGVPGTVNRITGTVQRRSDAPAWRDVPVKATLEREFTVSAFVINRHKGSGLAEAKHGAGTGYGEMVYLGISSGISAALFTGGKLIEGFHFGAGEVGHLTVEPDGPVCSCGRRGCLQALASGHALVEAAVQQFEQGKKTFLGTTAAVIRSRTGEEICRAAQNGDGVARTCLQDAGHYLGIAIANLVKTLNPEIVVLGGPIGLTEEPLLGYVQREARQLLSAPHSDVTIVPGRLGRDSGAIGAAAWVASRKVDLLFSR